MMATRHTAATQAKRFIKSSSENGDDRTEIRIADRLGRTAHRGEGAIIPSPCCSGHVRPARYMSEHAQTSDHTCVPFPHADSVAPAFSALAPIPPHDTIGAWKRMG